MTPALTTVAQDASAIGVAAVQILIERINGERDAGTTAVEQTFDAVLKIRESA
jgi:DNA-binding LacI/PurR family transcriptional regulator